MRQKLQIVTVLVLTVWVYACGSTGWTGTPAPEGSSAVLATAGEMGSEGTPGVVVPGPEPDTTLMGVRIFARRGCADCHSIGEGVVVGPDLEGVTDRRSFEWFQGLVSNPDSMLQADPSAKRLLADYGVAMPDLDIEEGEARALYAFLEDPARFVVADPTGSESRGRAGGCPHGQSGECPDGGCGECPHGQSGECPEGACGECPHCQSGECPGCESGDCLRCPSGECAHRGPGAGAQDGPKECGHHGGGKACGHHGSMGGDHSQKGKMGGCAHKHGPPADTSG
jgi:hypothetical protein